MPSVPAVLSENTEQLPARRVSAVGSTSDGLSDVYFDVFCFAPLCCASCS